MFYRMVKSLSFDNKLIVFFFIIFIISFRIVNHGFIFTFLNLFFMFVQMTPLYLFRELLYIFEEEYFMFVQITPLYLFRELFYIFSNDSFILVQRTPL